VLNPKENRNSRQSISKLLIRIEALSFKSATNARSKALPPPNNMHGPAFEKWQFILYDNEMI
jgi:hypothetical protein